MSALDVYLLIVWLVCGAGGAWYAMEFASKKQWGSFVVALFVTLVGYGCGVAFLR